MAIIYKALSSMDIEIQRQESIARNLTGAVVPGYRGETVTSTSFDGLLNQESNSGQGAVLDAKRINFNPGPLKHTGRPLDFALARDGFFEVQNEAGDTYYTRNGRFSLNESGELQTAEGFKVMSSDGNLTFGTDDDINKLIIKENGEIVIRANGEEKSFGSIKVIDIEDHSLFRRLGNSYFELPEGLDAGVEELEGSEFTLTSHTIEMANISAVKEMVTMIDSMRKYEMAQRMMKMTDALKTKEENAFA